VGEAPIAKWLGQIHLTAQSARTARVALRRHADTYGTVGIRLFCGFLLSKHSVRYRLAHSLIANRQILMRYKIFGKRTGLKVSKLALGTGMFGQTWGYGATPEEAKRIIEGFADAGGNFIDAADNYQHGGSETTIGDVITANRDNFVIASKFTRGASGNPALARLGNNRKNMVQSVEPSLKRLKTDRIDLYFAHMDDFVTPMDEIARPG
jgi:hypothetical protein